MKISFIALTFCLYSTVYSQKYSEQEKINLIQKIGIEITTSDLFNLTDNDFELITNFNYDHYRNEKTDRQIQLVRGPLAQVKSFNFCKENQILFDEKIYNLKKNEIENKTLFSIITQVNIGLGYKQNELNPENY
jgi:hypothetical protein